MPAPNAQNMAKVAKAQFAKLVADFNLERSAAPGDSGKSAEKAGHDLPLSGVQTIDPDVYLDGICAAISKALTAWHQSATLVGVIIHATTANGGQVVGPPLTPIILASGPKEKAEAMTLTQVIATTIGNAWLQVMATVKVSGLPLYPTFAAFPGPVGPPTPNTPVAFAALTMVAVPLTSDVLARTMVVQVSKVIHQMICKSVAHAFALAFNQWKTATMVTNVLGAGPIPSWAPPYVPVGPVVGGVGTMLPGGFV